MASEIRKGDDMKKADAEKRTQLLTQLNEVLADSGMLELQIVDPKKCVGADVNARYMKSETMLQLTENVKKGGTLESTPLVYRDDKLKEGQYRIISGHHRIEAAKNAGLKEILVMVCAPEDADDIVSKQLAHNALTGEDDAVLLQELFDSIKDVGKRMASGLQDELEKLSYHSLNFRAGEFKEFTLLFLPEDIDAYDTSADTIESCTKAIENSSIKPSSEVRIASLKTWEDMKKLVMKIKKVENIKSNAVALQVMTELALDRLNQLMHEQKDDAPAED